MQVIMKTSYPETIVDVREIPPPWKHPSIFEAWTKLQSGGALILVNDHDPVPLYYQFHAEHCGTFHWEYLDKGPEIFRIRIRKGDFKDPGFVPPALQKKANPNAAKEEEAFLLDVRPLFERGESPCGPIDDAVAQLKDGQRLVLLVPFEPKPLFAKLSRLGFEHQSHRWADGTWRIEFRRTGAASASSIPSCSHPGGEQVAPLEGDLHVDARNLEPPEPLVRTLEMLNRLKKGRRLTMQSSRNPLHLFEQLDQRGFQYECTEQPDHSFVTQIWHADESTKSTTRTAA
jgi:uncharacterized protein (DUF2249 family)